jgi:hypothetical protein
VESPAHLLAALEAGAHDNLLDRQIGGFQQMCRSFRGAGQDFADRTKCPAS